MDRNKICSIFVKNEISYNDEDINSIFKICNSDGDGIVSNYEFMLFAKPLDREYIMIEEKVRNQISHFSDEEGVERLNRVFISECKNPKQTSLSESEFTVYSYIYIYI